MSPRFSPNLACISATLKMLTKDQPAYLGTLTEGELHYIKELQRILITPLELDLPLNNMKFTVEKD